MVDWERVAELQGEIGAAAMAAVVPAFLDEMDAAVAGLQGNPATEELERGLHFLRGGALNLGFTAVAVACREGEAAMETGPSGRVGVERIVALYAKTRRAFVSGLVMAG